MFRNETGTYNYQRPKDYEDNDGEFVEENVFIENHSDGGITETRQEVIYKYEDL